MELVVVGAGGHGRDVAAIAEACGHIVHEFYDDDETLGHEPTTKLSPYAGQMIALGVNRPEARMALDRSYYQCPCLVHPKAIVDERIALAPGVVIAPGVTIANGVRLGRHVHVNLGCTLVRCTIGDYSTLAPQVSVCGDVTIGKGVFIGSGAVISNLVTIADGATIGAGAVVRDDVAENDTVVGVPARPLEVRGL